MSDRDTGVHPLVERAAAGARLLTARGVGMRAVSTLANLALIALVAPSDLGLLAVVRGIAGLAGTSSDFGFAWALLRRPRAPEPGEYAALAGIQLSGIVAALAILVLDPALLGSLAAIPREWRRGMIAVLVSMLSVAWGTGARVRIERDMDYRRLAFVDVSSVLLLNLLLVAFAVARQFDTGIFVATAVTTLYVNAVLWFSARGPGPAWRWSAWRTLGAEFAGFSLGHAGSMLNNAVTPILVARLFGLPVAGLWSVAVRFGNVLQVAFEGFRQAAIPAAAHLADSVHHLRDLGQRTMEGAARLTLPLAALIVAGLPVLGWVLPRWAPAVAIAQCYVAGYAVVGVIGAGVVPGAVALQGARIVLAEQFAPIVAGWGAFAILAATGHATIAWAVPPMFAATAIAVWWTASPAIRPRWSSAFTLPIATLIGAALIAATGSIADVRPAFTGGGGLLLACVFGAVAWRRRGALDRSTA